MTTQPINHEDPPQRVVPVGQAPDPFVVPGAVESRVPYTLTDERGLVTYGAGWDSTTVLVDVVAVSDVDGSRVHLLVPAGPEDTTSVNFAETLGDTMRRRDPHALGFVVIWPSGESVMNSVEGPGACASVYTFREVITGRDRTQFGSPRWADMTPAQTAAFVPDGFPDLDSWDAVTAWVDGLGLRADVDDVHRNSRRAMKETDARVQRLVDGW